MRSRVELLLDALKNASDDYSHTYARFNALDAKAQGAATVAGALLAASLAFAPQELFRKTVVSAYGTTATYAVRMVVLLAISALLLAYLALQVKPTSAPFRSDAVSKATVALLEKPAPQLTAAVIERHYLRQLDEWQSVTDDIADQLRAKAAYLTWSQASIVVAAICVAVFVWIALGAIRPT